MDKKQHISIDLKDCSVPFTIEHDNQVVDTVEIFLHSIDKNEKKLHIGSKNKLQIKNLIIRTPDSNIVPVLDLNNIKVTESLSYPNTTIDISYMFYVMLARRSETKRIKKFVYKNSELNLEGISAAISTLTINLDKIEDFDKIQLICNDHSSITKPDDDDDHFSTTFYNDNTRISIKCSNYESLQKAETFLPYIYSINLTHMDITEEQLQTFINKLPNLSSVIIENCSNIQDMGNLIDGLINNGQIMELKIDDENLFYNLPGVEFDSLNGERALCIDLSKYKGHKIVPKRYNEWPYEAHMYYLAIFLSPENSNLNDINFSEDNSIYTLTCINTEPLQCFSFNKQYQEFIDRFPNLYMLELEAITPDLEWLSSQDVSKKLDKLKIRYSDLLNRDLRHILKFKSLSELEISHSRKITDVSVLAQAEMFRELNLSHNRIHKGVDLILINQLKNLNLKDNLVTNKQIDFFIKNLQDLVFWESLQKIDFSENPITTIDFSLCKPGEDYFDKLYFNNCLIQNYTGSLNIDLNAFNQNPILLDRIKYCSTDTDYTKQAVFYNRIKKVFDEINLMIAELPMEERRKEFIKLCNNYYANPKCSEKGSNNIYPLFLGTLALAGIKPIDDDYYYCNGDEIVPIMEKDPSIMLQDNMEAVDELDSYMQKLQEEESGSKIITFYRANNSSPNSLPFYDYDKLNTFLSQLPEQLPNNTFFKLYSENRQTLHLFEIPKSLSEKGLPNKDLDATDFPNFVGAVSMKLISDKGNVTYLGIPCNESETNNLEDLETKKENLKALKSLIDDKYFYLQGSSDADLVLYGKDESIESLSEFLTTYLPIDKSLEKLDGITPKQALLDSFNLDDYNSILFYAQDIQEEITHKLDDLQKSMSASSEIKKVSSSLSQLESTFSTNGPDNKTVPTQKKGFLSRLFGSSTNKAVEYDNADSISQEETVKKVREDLKTSAQVIMENVASSKQAIKIIQDYVSKLNYYITIAREKLEDSKAKGTNSEQIEMLQRKIQSLEISRVLAGQTSTQFNIAIKNNSFLFERIYTATQLIPILSSQSILRSNIDSQNDVLQANKNMYNYAEETILSNAKELRQSSIDIKKIDDPMNMLSSVIESVKQLESSTLQPLCTNITPENNSDSNMLQSPQALEEEENQK